MIRRVCRKVRFWVELNSASLGSIAGTRGSPMWLLGSVITLFSTLPVGTEITWLLLQVRVASARAQCDARNT
jgi:hypothetical protein